jgi:agmatinase
MNKKERIASFDPNGIGLRNNHFIGLPFTEEEAEIVLLPVPWDVTVSYSEGTATGPSNILQASTQLDLMDPMVPDAWKMGVFMRHPDEDWIEISGKLRNLSQQYIDFLEQGGSIEESPEMKDNLDFLNRMCGELQDWVLEESQKLVEANKLPGIVGGEHSVPFGLLKALAEKYNEFGVLHIDAHMDLREAYEGFTYSHASIFNNAMQIPQLTKLVQVGIRDYCEEEVAFMESQNGRIKTFFDMDAKAKAYEGISWKEQCMEMIKELPELVYVSFDIDGLRPDLCPGTGTPVPGGLEFDEAMYLIHLVVESGRKIIGFDLSEVAGLGNEWDGNVGARVLYRLSNLAGKSNGLHLLE